MFYWWIDSEIDGSQKDVRRIGRNLHGGDIGCLAGTIGLKERVYAYQIFIFLYYGDIRFFIVKSRFFSRDM